MVENTTAADKVERFARKFGIENRSPQKLDLIELERVGPLPGIPQSLIAHINSHHSFGSHQGHPDSVATSATTGVEANLPFEKIRRFAVCHPPFREHLH